MSFTLQVATKLFDQQATKLQVLFYIKPPREAHGYQRYHTFGQGTTATQRKKENNVV